MDVHRNVIILERILSRIVYGWIDGLDELARMAFNV